MSTQSSVPRTVQPGDSIFFEASDGNTAIFSIPRTFKRDLASGTWPRVDVKLKKGDNIRAYNILDNHYNTIYMIDVNTRHLTGPVDRHPDPEELYTDIAEDDEVYDDGDEMRDAYDDAAAEPAAGDKYRTRAHGKDNRNLIDNNFNQKLSYQEVEELKRNAAKAASDDSSAAGSAGAAIINQLVYHSSTFHTKTQFSYQKYLKRKKEKFLRYVHVLEPTAQLLCYHFYSREPERTGYMRYDGLAQLMTLGNVYPSTYAMVYETCSGLVAAAMLERMCSDAGKECPPGRLLRMCDPSNTMYHFHCVHLLNNLPAAHKRQDPDRVPDLERDFVIHVPMHLVNQRAEDDPITGLQRNYESRSIMYAATTTPTESPTDDSDVTMSDAATSPAAEGTNLKTTPLTKDQRRAATMQRLEDRDHAAYILYNKFFNRNYSDIALSDTLIIATHVHDPRVILDKLWPFLANSGTFAIYSPFRETLEKIYIDLKQYIPTRAVAVQLTDTWTREYQVLPKRTHPMMRMTNESGFILSGVKVSN